MGHMIEWPPGSGRKAHYDDDEAAMMRGFIDQHEAGEITFDELQNQWSTMHDMKVEFHVRIPPPGSTSPEPQQSSLFPIPDKALAKMKEGQ